MRSLLLCIFCVLTVSSAIAHARPGYSVTDLGTLGGGYSEATALNDAGEVVGQSIDQNGSRRGFFAANGIISAAYNQPLSQSDRMSADGISASGSVIVNISDSSGGNRAYLVSRGSQTITPIPLLDPNFAVLYATGISDSGIVTGRSLIFYNGVVGGIGLVRTFIFDGASTIDIIPNVINTNIHYFGNAINDYGQITGNTSIGNYSVVLTTKSGFLWGKSVFDDLGDFGVNTCHTTGGYAINNHGAIAGFCTNIYNTADAVLYKDGVMTNISNLKPNGFGAAHGINDAGDVVGQFRGELTSFVTSFDYRAFIYSDGVMRDLNTLVDSRSGWFIYDARDINNKGQIAATGRKNMKRGVVITRALLLSPCVIQIRGGALPAGC